VLACEALFQLKLDRLLWVLTPTPPHKMSLPVSPVGQRLELVQAALAGEAHFELSRVDLDRPGPHYAVDTVQLLQAQFAGAQLIYLLGGDSLRDLPLWYHPRELVDLVSGLGVMRRPGAAFELESLGRHLPGIEQKVEFIETPQIEISSRDIRQRIAAGRPFRHYLPAGVYTLIEQHGYYRATTD
jgi:nicotinate-nucleotide adenylyltransferase